MAKENEILSHDEIRRYSRHLILPNVGKQGQEMLKQARVLLVGAGGLGCPVGMYLAAAGLGCLGIVEYDTVDESNLQRQVLYGDADIGRAKLDRAAERLAEINPFIKIEKHDLRLSSKNALKIIENYDLVIDGTDNFPTRYLVNDACVLLRKPYVYGSIFRFDGQVSVFDAQQGPCYRCLFPAPPPPEMVPSCAEGGVLGVLPGIIGSFQALEAIKLIIQQGQPLIGRLAIVNTLDFQVQTLKLRKRQDCPVCGEKPAITELIDYEEFCGLKKSSQDAAEATIPQITVRALKQRLDAGEAIFILDVREVAEYEIANIGGHLIPLNQLENRIKEVPESADIVVHCLSGARSLRASKILRAAGYQRVANLDGGIKAWAADIDPEMPVY